MASVILFVVGAIVSWVVLMIVLPLAQKLADFTLPGFVETAWKGAVIVLATNLISMVLEPISGFLAWIVSVVIFWIAMVRWFDVDFFGAVMIVVVSWVVKGFLVGLVIAILFT